MAQAKYTAEDIQVLEGLEPVRKRPGMYIGGTGKDGYHHLLWEVVDNSIDEVINKHATKVEVTLHKNGKSATVEDNGRGIPVDTHEKTGLSAVETVLTTLHAGGKFGGGGYKVSGGLHGVGASVVNALSSSLEVSVAINGGLYRQSYERGLPTSKLAKVRSYSVMFGDAAIKLNKFLRLIIRLELPPDTQQADIKDRLKADAGSLKVLELDIPCIRLQVRAGRNLAVMVEAAVRDFMLKMKGYDASATFIERHARLLQQRQRGWSK